MVMAFDLNVSNIGLIYGIPHGCLSLPKAILERRAGSNPQHSVVWSKKTTTVTRNAVNII